MSAAYPAKTQFAYHKKHTNGLIRRFFPKGTDFNKISDKEIARVEFILNSRGRKVLKFKSPNQVTLEYLMAA